MKKTFNININGAPFIIDEDAFQLINQYLETIKHAYAGNDADELLADIEGRIAELFILKMPSPQTIITVKMTEDVIRQIGNPCEFDDIIIDTTETTAGGTVEEEIRVAPPIPPQFIDPEPIHKQLFRDSRDKMIGGVCSGLAAYSGIDVSWVRIATVALAFLSFSVVVVIYIILWAILPEATTPLDFMKMRGERPTMDNIGRTVTGVFNTAPPAGTATPNPPSHKPANQRRRFADDLARTFGNIGKVILIIVGVISVPVLLVLAFVMVIALLAVIASFTSFNFWLPDEFVNMSGGIVLSLTILCGILIFGIPLGGLVWSIFTNGKKPMNPILRRSALVVWLIALVGGPIGYYKCVRNNIPSQKEVPTIEVKMTQTTDSIITTDTTDITDTDHD